MLTIKPARYRSNVDHALEVQGSHCVEHERDYSGGLPSEPILEAMRTLCMDHVNRLLRREALYAMVQEELKPLVTEGMYFGDYVLRLRDQLVLAITETGRIAIRAINPFLVAQLESMQIKEHWQVNGRCYKQWYLLPSPKEQFISNAQISKWINQAMEDINYRYKHSQSAQ